MSGEVYYVRARGKITGPFNVEELRSMRTHGQLGRFHEVSADQFTWAPASSLEHLFPAPVKPSSSGNFQLQAEAGSSGSAREGNWFYADEDDAVTGPTEWPRILELHQRRELDADAFVWREGSDSWTTVGAVLTGRSTTTIDTVPLGGPAWADVRLALWLFIGAGCVQLGTILIVVFGLLGAGSLEAIPLLALHHAETFFVIAGFLRLTAQITACVGCWYCRFAPKASETRELALSALGAGIAETLLAATGMILLAAGQGATTTAFLVLMVLALGAGAARSILVHLFLRRCAIVLHAPKKARILLMLLFYYIGASAVMLLAFVFAVAATSEGLRDFLHVLLLVTGAAWTGWLVWYSMVLLEMREVLSRP